jgi:hypothetical protein
MTEARKLLVLIGSPRHAGNSATLAKAEQRGAEATVRGKERASPSH